MLLSRVNCSESFQIRPRKVQVYVLWCGGGWYQGVVGVGIRVLRVGIGGIEPGTFSFVRLGLDHTLVAT